MFGWESPGVVNTVAVGTGAKTAELGGDLSCPLPSFTLSSLVAIAHGIGVGDRTPGTESWTQISGCQDPLETESRRTKNIFSKHINP